MVAAGSSHLHHWAYVSHYRLTFIKAGFVIVKEFMACVCTQSQWHVQTKTKTCCCFFCVLSASDGGKGLLQRKEGGVLGQGEDVLGGRVGCHDQEVPRCLGAAGSHQPRAAKERKVSLPNPVQELHGRLWRSETHHSTNLWIDKALEGNQTARWFDCTYCPPEPELSQSYCFIL